MIQLFRKDFKTDCFRALRIALATVIAILLYHLLHLANGYWVLLSTIITIQANLGASIKRAKDRIFGTILGVLIGVMLAVIFPNSVMFLLLIAPVLIFFALYLFRASYAYAIFFASILLILLLAQTHLHATPWHFAANRIIATFLGVAVGLVASYLFWPSCARFELQRYLTESMETFRDFFAFVTGGFFERHYDEETLQDLKAKLQLALQTNRQSLEEFSYEAGIMRVSNEAALSFVLSLERIHDVLMSLTLVLRNPSYEALPADEFEKLKGFMTQVDQMFAALIVHGRGEGELPSSVVLDRMAIRLEQQLITTPVLREALTRHASQSLSLIILVRGMKRIAAELKYMASALNQLVQLAH